MKNKIVTLFGGSGQIGSNLIGPLIKKNYRVIVVTRSAFQNGHLKTKHLIVIHLIVRKQVVFVKRVRGELLSIIQHQYQIL